MARPKLNEMLNNAARPNVGYSNAEEQNNVVIENKNKMTMQNSKIADARIGKKSIAGYFDIEVSKQMKLIALKENTSLQEVLREAINDFFNKKGMPPIA